MGYLKMQRTRIERKGPYNAAAGRLSFSKLATEIDGVPDGQYIRPHSIEAGDLNFSVTKEIMPISIIDVGEALSVRYTGNLDNGYAYYGIKTNGYYVMGYGVDHIVVRPWFKTGVPRVVVEKNAFRTGGAVEHGVLKVKCIVVPTEMSDMISSTMVGPRRYCLRTGVATQKYSMPVGEFFDWRSGVYGHYVFWEPTYSADDISEVLSSVTDYAKVGGAYSYKDLVLVRLSDGSYGVLKFVYTLGGESIGYIPTVRRFERKDLATTNDAYYAVSSITREFVREHQQATPDQTSQHFVLWGLTNENEISVSIVLDEDVGGFVVVDRETISIGPYSGVVDQLKLYASRYPLKDASYFTVIHNGAGTGGADVFENYYVFAVVYSNDAGEVRVKHGIISVSIDSGNMSISNISINTIVDVPVTYNGAPPTMDSLVRVLWRPLSTDEEHGAIVFRDGRHLLYGNFQYGVSSDIVLQDEDDEYTYTQSSFGELVDFYENAANNITVFVYEDAAIVYSWGSSERNKIIFGNYDTETSGGKVFSPNGRSVFIFGRYRTHVYDARTGRIFASSQRLREDPNNITTRYDTSDRTLVVVPEFTVGGAVFRGCPTGFDGENMYAENDSGDVVSGIVSVWNGIDYAYIAKKDATTGEFYGQRYGIDGNNMYYILGDVAVFFDCPAPSPNTQVSINGELPPNYWPPGVERVEMYDAAILVFSDIGTFVSDSMLIRTNRDWLISWSGSAGVTDTVNVTGTVNAMGGVLVVGRNGSYIISGQRPIWGSDVVPTIAARQLDSKQYVSVIVATHVGALALATVGGCVIGDGGGSIVLPGVTVYGRTYRSYGDISGITFFDNGEPYIFGIAPSNMVGVFKAIPKIYNALPNQARPFGEDVIGYGVNSDGKATIILEVSSHNLSVTTNVVGVDNPEVLGKPIVIHRARVLGLGDGNENVTIAILDKDGNVVEEKQTKFNEVVGFTERAGLVYPTIRVVVDSQLVVPQFIAVDVYYRLEGVEVV